MQTRTADTQPTFTGNHLVAMKLFMAIAPERFRGELIELRYRLEDDHRMRQIFEKPSRAGTLARRAIELSERADVYVGCAPRTRRHGGRDSVKRSFLLWADCDGEDAEKAMRRFDPEPSIIIASGIIRTERSRSASRRAVRCWRHVADGGECEMRGGLGDDR